MCGITGFIGREGEARESSRVLLEKMTRRLIHRGPDSEGYWQSADGRVNLGHRRLAIIDLTASGHQPMLTPDGRFALSFNGEIYNFEELKRDLEATGSRFTGMSDTEVLLQALARWGVEPALRRLNGMFVFALWDNLERKLWIARDRFGEKPLYYSWQSGRFIFGSELKALTLHPGFKYEIDRNVLSSYMRFNYVPWPRSIYKDVSKLPPGHFLEVDLSGAARESKPYWQLSDLTMPGVALPQDDSAMIDQLEQVLAKAVRQRMVADVPLGAFLSGGVDSSTVVALMQSQSSRPIKTFTIGFWDTNYNEAEDAAKVARHLGTEHHEHYLSSRECMDLISMLPGIYDEPFADSSQIPTVLVSQFARRHVTVALSGDGGDEMLGGYNRYIWTQRIWRVLQFLPMGACNAGRDLVHSLSPDTWNQIFAPINYVLPERLRIRGGGDKVHKLSSALGAKDTDSLYRGFVSQWQNPEGIVCGAREVGSLLDDPGACPAGLNVVEKMMYLDQMTYLPSDILTKVDRASMSASLEVRVPFLDNEVARLSWSLPVSAKIRGGVTKWPLRQVLKRYVPAALFERPKAGFGVPTGDWLRGPLREWAEELLDERKLRASGYFEPGVVRKEWEDHLSGRRNAQNTLWSVLMFEGWRQRWEGDRNELDSRCVPQNVSES